MSGEPSVQRPVEVCVVENHPLYRSALVRTLEEAGMRVAVAVRSVEELAAMRPAAGCVVSLDVKLPGLSDAAAVARVVGLGCHPLVLSAHGVPTDVLAAVAAGARGYLTKDAEGDEILRAVREIAAGNTYVSPTLAALLLDSSRGNNTAVQIPLSGRERQVLSRLASGERDQDIASALSISVRTVRSHLDRIREKTGLRRRAELTRYAIEEGISS